MADFDPKDLDKTLPDDGGQAFGLVTVRDYFAASCQEDDRLVKCIRAMDDTALEMFALHPDAEREEHIAEVDMTNWMALPSEVAKVTRRLELEARAIARVRFMQADAMLAERKRRV